jgi:beta-phosphoglucomutase-like phosphatase (HAD superfamily)
MRCALGMGDADIEMAVSPVAVRLPGGSDLADVPSREHILELAGRPTFPPDLDHLAAGWQQALDAADRALHAAGRSLPTMYIAQEQKELAQERKQTAATLAQLAHVTGALPEPWLSPSPLTTEMLGLPTGVEACLFDLDGVLTDSAIVHVSAWGLVFDDFLQRMNEKTGWHFIPFTDKDYRLYMDGRSRLEAIHAFLGSRGIRLPEGRADDPAAADTAQGLARRKGEALARGLRQRGVNALPGSRRFVQAAGHARLKRSVISASAHTFWMLELAGLATIIDDCVDAHAMSSEALRAWPAPDLLLAACARLGVRPENAVTLTHSEAGVAAGRAAGLQVVGVAGGAQAERLENAAERLENAAERVVPSLNALLESRLRDTTSVR